jgi:hypothetical protein
LAEANIGFSSHHKGEFYEPIVPEFHRPQRWTISGGGIGRMGQGLIQIDRATNLFAEATIHAPAPRDVIHRSQQQIDHNRFWRSKTARSRCCD